MGTEYGNLEIGDGGGTAVGDGEGGIVGMSWEYVGFVVFRFSFTPVVLT
jgi:hypothetical protein